MTKKLRRTSSKRTKSKNSNRKNRWKYRNKFLYPERSYVTIFIEPFAIRVNKHTNCGKYCSTNSVVIDEFSRLVSWKTKLRTNKFFPYFQCTGESHPFSITLEISTEKKKTNKFDTYILLITESIITDRTRINIYHPWNWSPLKILSKILQFTIRSKKVRTKSI